MNNKIRVGLIYGSTREGRFCDKVAAWVGSQIVGGDQFALDMIDPAAMDLPVRHERRTNAGLEELRNRMALADAFIIVTPEYNHGYPASLKFLIDSVGEPWHAKPIGFVSYGGLSGGLRAVEQLRLVFAEMHAVTVRDAVYFVNAWEQFDHAGQLSQPERAQRSLATMLARLKWWAVALREARSLFPYGEVAA
jgi:NAD(P)H-dependent FMN reductase